MSAPFIVIDSALAAAMLRDLAARVEAGEYEVTHIENTFYKPLHHGFVTVKYKEPRT